LWSIGNEVMERDGHGEGFEISRILAEYVREVDSTRPVTAAICESWRGAPWNIMDPAFATLDVGDYNYPWEQYRTDNERLPDRIMMGTESFPLQAFENWQAVEDIPAIIGDFVWTSLDFLSEAGIGRTYFDEMDGLFLGSYPWHQVNCGDLDLCGFKRPQSYYRDLLWNADPHIYIAVHPPVPDGKELKITAWGWPDVWPNWNWPGYEGQSFKVEVYANCEEVELFYNSQSLGWKQCSLDEKFKVDFKVDYQPGELRAVGYISGKLASEHVLTTTGVPSQIWLIPDRQIIHADALDLCYLTVEVQDAKGQIHPTADQNIFFTVSGPVNILAVGSSNPLSEELYIGNQRSVHRGRALVVFKSTDKAGEIRLTAQADGLKGAKVTINSIADQE